jgi:hypothetical protein
MAILQNAHPSPSPRATRSCKSDLDDDSDATVRPARIRRDWNELDMDVKRYRHEWRMRWTTNAEEASATHSVAPEELCAHCDDGGMWITVPDIRPMPKPTVIYGCRRCGTMTAHADLPVILRSVGD